MKLLNLILTTLTITPNIIFAPESAYTKDEIITTSVVEEYDGTKSLVIEKNYVFGYEIYDDPDTDYIDGVVLDGEYLHEWTVHNFDVDAEHTICIKTVYSDSIDGAFAAAKDGDYSRIMSNPIMVFQLIYYILSTLVLVFSALGITRSKKKDREFKKALTIAVKEVVAEMSKESNDTLINNSKVITQHIVDTIYSTIHSQNVDIIKAFVLSRSNKKEDVVALLDLLNKTASEDTSKIIETIKTNIIKEIDAKTESKSKALKLLEKFKKEEVKDTNIDNGTSI